MELKDSLQLKGVFHVDVIKAGTIIETYEENNMIVDLCRSTTGSFQKMNITITGRKCGTAFRFSIRNGSTTASWVFRIYRTNTWTMQPTSG